MKSNWDDLGDLSNVKFSEVEYNALQIKERYSALEVAKRIRLDPSKNRFDHIDLELTPYLKFPIQCMGLAEVLWIYAIAPTQSGKTLLAQIFLADRIDQDSGTFLYVLPNAKSGERQFQEKVISLIESSPFLNPHIMYPKKDNLSMTRINLDCMSIYPGWAHSPTSMNSITAIAGVLDEIRLMPIMIRKETNAIEYMEDRVETYVSSGRAQLLGVTTPRDEQDLMYRQLNKPFTSIYWWMHPCPRCGRFQLLDIYENFIPDGDIYKPICRCKFCREGTFSDRMSKRKLNATGMYVKIEDEGKVRKDIPDPEPNKHVICRWTRESSPFTSFQTIAEKHSKCVGDYSALNNFNQTWRARFTKVSKSKTSVENLRKRVSNLEKGVVPDWCKLLTCGIDSQADGFYYWVTAHGMDGKRHCVETGFIENHYMMTTDEDIHYLFKEHFEEKTWIDTLGKRWALALWGIDTGAYGTRTSQIYGAIRGLSKCIPCKGRKVDENIKVTVTKDKTRLYLVNTYNYLEITDKQSVEDTWTLYKGISRTVLKQFCNVRKIIEIEPDKYGDEVMLWKKFGHYDYRYACLHSEIVLDVRTSYNNKVIRFRDLLADENFKYNPIFEIDKKQRNFNKSKEREQESQNKQRYSEGEEINIESDKPMSHKFTNGRYSARGFSDSGFSV